MAEDKDAEKPELPKLKFRATQKSPTLDLGHGDYRRRFEAKDQPFEVESEEEYTFLKNTGYFVDAKEAPAEVAATDISDQPTSDAAAAPSATDESPVEKKEKRSAKAK